MNVNEFYYDDAGVCIPAYGVSLEPGRVCMITENGVLWEGTVHVHTEEGCVLE